MLQLIAIAALCIYVILQSLEMRKLKERIEQLENNHAELRQQLTPLYQYNPAPQTSRIPTRNPDDLP